MRQRMVPNEPRQSPFWLQERGSDPVRSHQTEAPLAGHLFSHPCASAQGCYAKLPHPLPQRDAH